MSAPETPYSVCTDPACVARQCTACREGIHSLCHRDVRCPSTGETHPCRCTVRGGDQS